MVLFLGISWFFKFPQSLNAQVTLTTATPPAELHARSSGQLDFVAVKDKERVEAGAVLAGRRVAGGVFGFQAEFGKLPELSKKELLSTQNSLKERGAG